MFNVLYSTVQYVVGSHLIDRQTIFTHTHEARDLKSEVTTRWAISNVSEVHKSENAKPSGRLFPRKWMLPKLHRLIAAGTTTENGLETMIYNEV